MSRTKHYTETPAAERTGFHTGTRGPPTRRRGAQASPAGPAPSRARRLPAPRPARSAGSPGPPACGAHAPSCPWVLAPAPPWQGSPLLFPAPARKSKSIQHSEGRRGSEGPSPRREEPAGRGSAANPKLLGATACSW